MINELIKQIFKSNNLGDLQTIEKIEIGFSNKIYSIDDKYILKICGDLENEPYIAKEVFLFNFFENIIPVPKVIAYDNTKSICDSHYLIYHKIQGDNLYSVWHLMNNEERRDIVKQLCNILKKINNASCDEFVNKFKIDKNIDWQDIIISKIKKSLKEVSNKKLIPSDFIQAINNFVENNKHVLKEQKIALTYYDAHFDNVLVKDNKIVGLLDLERTELFSIDYALDIIQRMVDIPHKYMSEESEKYCKPEDYMNLLHWFKEFYPELFGFKNMDKRLALYGVEHDLRDLIHFPEIDNIKKTIANFIDYNIG
ncbi:MAG: hypothetical protein COU51_03790 [Parcubacteria group bacterium CG10_big_fil_rev_8_21_14_0_10_36_14]|nr:MAG: hypothetical protein COU51_03790 [Parcubacteria group bacterium CG10_big_fil_rev_8_21_14_0_10_36_14]